MADLWDWADVAAVGVIAREAADHAASRAAPATSSIVCSVVSVVVIRIPSGEGRGRR
jgi:hypothetical protein